MRDTEIEIVQASWAKVAPIAPQAATMFYERLLTTNPELKPLFANTDLATQKVRLVSTLTMAVSNLGKTETLRDGLFELGKRHRSYGVKRQDYDAVGAALIWTLEQGLGEGWANEVREAWVAVYEFVATEMKKGAHADERFAA